MYVSYVLVGMGSVRGGEGMDPGGVDGLVVVFFVGKREERD